MNKFICDKCGLCCKSLSGNPLAKELDNGNGICKYLNPDTNLCNIYDERPDICNVEKGYAYFKTAMTYDEYLELNYDLCKKLKRRKI